MPAARPREASTLFAVALLAAFAFVLVVAVVANGGPLERDRHDRDVGYGQIRFDGAGPERWAQLARRRRAELDELRAELRRERKETRETLRRQRRVLLSRPTVAEAINLAATVYGNGSTLWRKARCESRLDPQARNRKSSASGLFQFLGSTWDSTPFAGFPVTSPYANALAAGWMHAHGRGGEWSCR